MMPKIPINDWLRRADAAIARGVARLQRVLRWTRGETARAWARWLALFAASPAIISSLPVAVSLLVIGTVAALNIYQGKMASDRDSLMAGVGALIRFFLLAGAVLTAALFFLAPSLIGGSIALATASLATEGYLTDLD